MVSIYFPQNKVVKSGKKFYDLMEFSTRNWKGNGRNGWRTSVSLSETSRKSSDFHVKEENLGIKPVRAKAPNVEYTSIVSTLGKQSHVGVKKLGDLLI